MTVFNKNEKYKFITIEGGIGDAAEVFIPFIQEYLESKGESVIITREPGGTDLGEKLRKLILNNPMDSIAETLLIFSARAQHIKEVIVPALNEGKWVLCDRFTDATFAYQSAGKDVAESVIKGLQDIVQKGLNPGLTLVFDIPLNVSKKRLVNIERELDKFESEGDLFNEKVNLGYKTLVKRNPARCKLIDTDKDLEDVKEQVMNCLDFFYNEVK